MQVDVSDSLFLPFQEVISLVRSCGLELESQAGRSVGYRQVLTYLKTVWGFPHESGAGDSTFVAQVRERLCVRDQNEVESHAQLLLQKQERSRYLNSIVGGSGHETE